jgi:ribosomal protein L11 methyltransferase
MDFIEITVAEIDGEAAETVSELYNRYGYGGAVLETYPPDFDKSTVRTVIAAEDDERLGQIEMMLALIGQALPNGLPTPKLRIVGQNDWATSWKEHFHVIRVAQHFVIKPSWREYSPTPADLVLEIDPGLAFGSGLHPTTQLCLKILEGLAVQNKSFFDVGTGSGVLSLAALKLGARAVRAVDVDDVALRVARENFELNGYTEASAVLPHLETAVGSADSHGAGTWDIVVANILAHILIEIMADLKAALEPGGCLILSGIIAEQEPELLTALTQHRLSIVERHVDGDWVAFVVQRANF